MMRRNIFVLILIMLLSGYCVIAKVGVDYRSMDIGMNVDPVPRIFISQENIGSTAESAIDLNADGITDLNGGIKIAEWSIYSNTDYIKVTIDAEDLVLGTNNQIKIPYLLYFDSSHYDNGSIQSSYFYIMSESYNGQYKNLIAENNVFEFDTQTALGVNFEKNQIKFILTDEDISKKENGIYRAEVKITIEAKEGGEI